MLEKLNQIAERAATGVSRREFLGRLGRGAAGAAGALGGWLMLPRTAQAGRRLCHGIVCGPNEIYCCHSHDTIEKGQTFFCSAAPCQ